KLSVWWLRLGITIERIRPGHPQQNGRHKRMNPTLKHETTAPRRHEQSATANQVRRFSRGIQQRATSPSSRHEVPCGSLYAPPPSLSRPTGTGLSFPRQNHPRHLLRTYLSSPQKNQSQHGLRWSSCRYQRSRRRYLAGQLYELRSWLRRSGGKNFATSRKPFWPKSVTHVSGTICNLCVRAGPKMTGAGDGNRTQVRSWASFGATSFHITPEDRQAPPHHLQARALAKGGPEPSS